MPLVDQSIFREVLAKTYRLSEVSSSFRENVPLFTRTFPLPSKTAFHLPFGYTRHWHDWDAKLKITPWEELCSFGKEHSLNIVLNSVGELGIGRGVPRGFHSRLVMDSDIRTVKSIFSKNFRKYLANQRNRAHQSEVLAAFETSPLAVHEFYDLLVRQYVRHHKMLFHPLELFERLLAGGFARLLTARREGQLIGALFVLYDDFTAYYSWGAREVGDHLAVHSFLIDSLIDDCVSKGIKELDFGLTPLSDNHLMDYKKKWGTETSMVYSYWTTKIPNLRDLNSSFPILRNLYQKAPISLAKVLSPILVRGLIC